MDLNQTIVTHLWECSPFALYEATLKDEVEFTLGKKVEAAAFNRALTHLQFIQLVGSQSEAATGKNGYFFQGQLLNGVRLWR